MRLKWEENVTEMRKSETNILSSLKHCSLVNNFCIVHDNETAMEIQAFYFQVHLSKCYLSFVWLINANLHLSSLHADEVAEGFV